MLGSKVQQSGGVKNSRTWCIQLKGRENFIKVLFWNAEDKAM